MKPLGTLPAGQGCLLQEHLGTTWYHLQEGQMQLTRQDQPGSNSEQGAVQKRKSLEHPEVPPVAMEDSHLRSQQIKSTNIC